MVNIALSHPAIAFSVEKMGNFFLAKITSNLSKMDKRNSILIYIIDSTRNISKIVLVKVIGFAGFL